MQSNDTPGPSDCSLAELAQLRKQLAALEATEVENKRWKKVIEGIPDHVILVDPQAKILYINHTVPELTVAGVLGRPLFDFLPPDMHQRCRTCLESVVATAQPSSYFANYIGADGATAYYETQVGPATKADGTVAALVLRSTDITIAHQATELRRHFVDRVTAAQDAERRRISGELHDHTGQALASIVVRLQNLEEQTEGADLRQQLSALTNYTGQTVAELRRLARGLHPSQLEDLGFCAAIESLVSSIAESAGQRIGLDMRGCENEKLLPQKVSIALYRVVQEALSNAVKHANAQHISVTMHPVQVDDDNPDAGVDIRTIIEDDGCGMSADRIQAAASSPHIPGLGLVGIKERASLLDGKVEIETSPGGGTSIRVNLPMIRP